MLRTLSGWLLVLTAALTLAGCKSGGNRTRSTDGAMKIEGSGRLPPASLRRTPQNGGVFQRPLAAEPGTLNPLLATDQVSYLVYKWIYDPLVDMDRDQHFVGVLARSWEISDGGRQMTLHLRKNVRWHDGVPFTADDVVFTFRAMAGKNVDDPAWKGVADRIAHVRKLDRWTVLIEWKKPYAPGLADLILYILPRHLYETDKGDLNLNDNPWNFKPIGTGPYEFESWQRGQSITLKANPHYFKGRPHLDRLVFRILPDSQSQYAAFLTGHLDLARLSPGLLAKARTDPSFVGHAHLFEYMSREFFYMAWNENGSNPFFRDRRVRLAMTLALDRKGVVEHLLHGHGVLCSGPFFPGGWAADPAIAPVPFDPARARRLLRQAGWRDSDGDGWLDREGRRFEFTCLYPEEADAFRRFLALFQQDLKQVGVKMDLAPLEWNTFLQRTSQHRFEAYLSGYTMGDDPNPYAMYDSREAAILPDGSAAGANDVSYSNPQMDALLKAQLVEMNRRRRQKLLWKIHDIIARDQPQSFLFIPTTLAAVDKRIQDVEPSSAGYGLFSWYPSALRWWVPARLQEAAPRPGEKK